jgi:hypothetical protein
MKSLSVFLGKEPLRQLVDSHFRLPGYRSLPLSCQPMRWWCA